MVLKDLQAIVTSEGKSHYKLEWEEYYSKRI